MNYKEFFTLDNKSGIKTKESYIISNYPEIHDKIKKFIKNNNLVNLSFKEEVYYFINNIVNKHICLNCGANVKFKGTVNKGYSDYCSLKCANDSGDLINRQKESTFKKYGVDSTNKLDFVKAKKKEVIIERYGVDNVMKNDDIKSKYKESIKKKYGTDNVMKNDDIKSKYKDSIINEYGVDHLFKSEQIKLKIKNTNLNNLGVDYPTQSELIKTKIKDISLNKLMNKFPFIKSVNGDILTCGCDVCDSDYTISRVLLNERNREGYGLCTNCNQIGVNTDKKKLFKLI